MMRFSPNLKKMLLIGTIVLLGCDVSMLFAAQNNDPNAAMANENNPQLQQLQAQAQQAEQVQAQIRALQNTTAATTTAAPVMPKSAITPPAVSSDPANKNNLLPPAPFAASANAASNIPNNPAVLSSGTGQPAVAAIPSSPFGGPTQTTPAAVLAQQPDAIPSNPAVPANAGNAGTNTTTAPTNPITENDINDAAFNAMVQNSLPMSPDQIQKLRSVYMASQFAAVSSPVTPPRPTATSVFVDLAPGSTPPVVRLSQGFVSSLVFVDSSGAPWPIESYDIGNPTAFNIQWDKTSNTLMIQATVLYTYGNLAVKLRGLNTPVMLTLVPGQKAVDYRVDLRVQGSGPNARPSASPDVLPSSTSSDLLNVLDGVPPAGSKALKVEGGNCQAWLAGEKMYVRTRLSVLSPGWEATLSSADGMHAYQMQQTPMLLVSQNGQVLQLKVEGF